jgi:hypothetical protein
MFTRRSGLTVIVLAVYLLLVVTPLGAQDDLWLRYHDPSGIGLRYPSGWQVQSSEGMVTVADPALTSFVVVYVFAPMPGYTAAQCVGDMITAFGQTLPNAAVQGSQQVSTQPDESVTNLTYDAGVEGAGFASVICRVDQGRGLLVLGATPQSRYDTTWPVITRIVNSITTAETGTAYDAQITYTTWNDPQEGAFSLEVPQGWKVTGGMFDISGNKRPVVQMLSPDEKVLVNLGTADVIWFVVPTAELTQQGYPAGATIYSQDHFGVMVADYMTGAEGARFLAEQLIAPTCAAFEITATRDLPEQSGYTTGGFAYSSAGEAAFTCTYQNQPVAGYYYLTTLTTDDPNLGQVWTIDTVLGYIAVTERTNEAGAVLVRAYQTLTLNPEWVSLQQQAASTAAYTGAPSGGDMDPETFQILSEVNQMQHETSLIIIDNIDGVTDYEYTYDYDYDYGW